MAQAPAAFEIVNADGASPYVLTCEHASNFIPEAYRGLGLGSTDLVRHIAWDIGAADLARKLAGLLDAPLVLSGYSRLLIDCNRPIGTPTSIPEISEATAIPGNSGIAEREKTDRAARFYWPFQNAVAALLDRRKYSIIVGIHSFTPVFKGSVRPWHAGILFRKSAAFGSALAEALHEPGLAVAANEPYQIGEDTDYTVPVHGEARGRDAVLIEIRQDQLIDRAASAAWSLRLARALSAVKGSAQAG